jgi:hypothetical protein
MLDSERPRGESYAGEGQGVLLAQPFRVRCPFIRSPEEIAMSYARPLATATLLVVTACGATLGARAGSPGGTAGTGSSRGPGDALTGRSVSPRGPVDPSAGGDLGGQGVPVAARGNDGSHAVADERRVCRSGSRPSGWVAVAYVSGNGQCPARSGSDSAFSAVVLARYTVLPVHATLDVCADERVPQGWVVDGTQPGDVSESCPGAGPNGGSATRRIRRAR